MKKTLSLLGLSILFSLGSIVTWAQTTEIKGQVLNDKGEPVSYATVTETGTSRATTADTAGRFTLKVSKPNVKITITATGYQSQTVTLSGTTVNVVLKAGNAQLEEVIVTALGQTRGKDKVGYAATTFKSADVNRAAPVSPLDGLKGRVPGADISTVSGMPGGSSKIIIRGYTSLSTSGSNNQALIVVDGVPFNNSRLGSFNDFLNSGGVDIGNGLNDLDPNTIDNITILKGAAATSLYGSRASNGVVLITTKKGRSGKLSVDFSSSVILSSVGKLPDFQNAFGQGWFGQHYKEENGSWGPKTDGRVRLWGSQVDNSRLLKPFVDLEDNVRDFYDQGTEVNNSVAVRGGNDNANFYFSYGNVYSNGILPEDADVYRRNTFSTRGQLKSNKFTTAVSLNYINKAGNTQNTEEDENGSSTFSNIIQMPRDMPITDFKDYNNKFFNVNNFFTPYASNPYFSLFENVTKYQTDRFFGNAELGYDFSKVFNIRWKTGLDVTNARLKSWQAVERPNPNTWRGNPATNEEGPTAFLTPLLGSVREISDYGREINSDFFINYNKDIVSDLNLSGFIGANYNEREFRTQDAKITDLVIPGFYNLTNTRGNPVEKPFLSRRRLIGLFGQANLSFKDFLYLTINARNDWSSTLPVGANSFFYPSINASFIISRVADLSNTAISYLKVRAALGKTGKDAPVYNLASVGLKSESTLGFGNITFPLHGLTAFELGNIIGAPNLKPEISTEIEGGIEAAFLDSRLGFDLTLYRKRTKGQILDVPIAPSTGYQALTSNFGLVENNGIELSVTLVPVKTRNFTWTIDYSFSKNNNKVLELPAGLDKVDFNSLYDAKMVARVGQPIGIIEAPTKTMVGDKYLVSATTGFFVQTSDDVPYGNIQRDYAMGVNNTFSYKDWALAMNFDYRKGGYFFSYTADLTYFTGNAWMTQYNDRKPFIIPNSVVEAGVDTAGKTIYAENTTPVTADNYYDYWYHTNNQGKAYGDRILPKDYLKLRDVTLSYRLPVSWSKKIHANSIALSFTARNILLWVPKENMFIDPEVTNLGNDLLGEFGEVATSPTSLSYGATLKINF